MLFVFVSTDGILYKSPDNYVLSQKYERISWGTELKIYQVYKKDDIILSGAQTIKAMFNHEGSEGTLNDITWYGSCRYTMIETQKNVDLLMGDQIIKYDLGDCHPLYYRNKSDLIWYLSNVVKGWEKVVVH